MSSIFLTTNDWSQTPADTAVDANQFPIVNLPLPVNNGDAVNKQYADSLAGGLNPSQWATFPATTNVNMVNHKLINVQPPTFVTDASNKGYVDGAVLGWANNVATTNVNMDGHQIKNVGMPLDRYDAVNRDFVDDAVADWSFNRAVSGLNMDNNNITNVNSISATGSYAGTANLNSVSNNTEYPIITAGDGVGVWAKKLASNNMEALMLKTHYISGQPNTALSITQYGDIGIGTFALTDDIRAKLHIINPGTFDSFRVDDEATDTTYFKIDNAGRVGVMTGNTALSYPFTVNGNALIINNTAPNPELIFSGQIGNGADTLCSISAQNGSLANRSLQLYNAKNVGANPAFRFVGGNGTTTPILEMYGNKTAKFYGTLDSGNQAVINVGLLGVGVATPLAKLHILQEANQDSFRVDDQANDTTYFKIDAEGRCSINAGASATATKTLNIGTGVSDTTSALKFNSGDGDKIFLTSFDAGSRISQLPQWGFQFTAGIDTGTSNNQGFYSWRTGGVSSFVERMRLENNGTLNTMNNKIINVGTPTDGTDAVNKSYVDTAVASAIGGDSTKNIYVESSQYATQTNITIDFNDPSINFNSVVITVRLVSPVYYKQIYFANYNTRSMFGKRITVFLTYDSDPGSLCNVFAPDGSTRVLINASGYAKTAEFIGGNVGEFALEPYWRIISELS